MSSASAELLNFVGWAAECRLRVGVGVMCFLKTCCDSIKHHLLDHLTMLDQHICMHLSGVIMAENEKLSMSVIEPGVPDLDLLNVMALRETF